jgi:hypothetical protein
VGWFPIAEVPSPPDDRSLEGRLRYHCGYAPLPRGMLCDPLRTRMALLRVRRTEIQLG